MKQRLNIRRQLSIN